MKRLLIIVTGIFFTFSLFSQINTENKVTKEIYVGSFTVNGDKDTYYPVVFKYGDQDKVNKLRIFRRYSEAGPNELSPTHKGALTLEIDVNYGGWGGAQYNWRIMDLRQLYHTTFAGASLGMHNIGFIVWLRGGGFVYKFESEKATNLQVAYSTSELIYDHSNNPYDVYAPAAKSNPDEANINSHLLNINSGVDKSGNLRITGNGSHYISKGNVGIGTTNPSAKLDVNGSIRAERIDVINDVPSADYVFEADYELRSISEVEEFISNHKHLPDVPSAAEFKSRGYSVGEMDEILLRKIEELTLYIIEQQKVIDELLKSE